MREHHNSVFLTLDQKKDALTEFLDVLKSKAQSPLNKIEEQEPCVKAVPASYNSLQHGGAKLRSEYVRLKPLTRSS